MDDKELGPAMRALDRRRRLFVLAFIDDPTAPKSELARRAGYADKATGYVRVQAHRLMRGPKVIAAIREEMEKRAMFGGVLGIAGLLKMASDLTHPDCYKACSTLAGIAGYVPKTEHKVTVEHIDHGRMAEIASRLAAELGLDRMKLIGGNVIEGKIGSKG